MRSEARLRCPCLRNNLTIVREIALDAAIDEHHILIGEHNLVRRKANGNVFFHLRKAGNLLKEHARNNRLEILLHALKRNIGHSKAIRVGRNHAQAFVRRGDKHAREHCTALILRDNLRHALNHRTEFRERHLDGTRNVNVGERGEVGCIERFERERRFAARYRDGGIVRLELHSCLRQVFNDIQKKLLGNNGCSLFFNESRNAVTNRAFEVGGFHNQPHTLCFNVDARKHRDGRARSCALRHDGQCIKEFALVDVESHFFALLLLNK